MVHRMQNSITPASCTGRPRGQNRAMSTPINTAKVLGRRQLRFHSLDEIAADVERLAAFRHVQPLGNWSPGQVLEHLTLTMNNSIDGFPQFVPALIKPLLRMFMKRRFLSKAMPAGFKLPAKAAER